MKNNKNDNSSKIKIITFCFTNDISRRKELIMNYLKKIIIIKYKI